MRLWEPSRSIRLLQISGSSSFEPQPSSLSRLYAILLICLPTSHRLENQRWAAAKPPPTDDLGPPKAAPQRNLYFCVRRRCARCSAKWGRLNQIPQTVSFPSVFAHFLAPPWTVGTTYRPFSNNNQPLIEVAPSLFGRTANSENVTNFRTLISSGRPS